MFLSEKDMAQKLGAYTFARYRPDRSYDGRHWLTATVKTRSLGHVPRQPSTRRSSQRPVVHYQFAIHRAPHASPRARIAIAWHRVIAMEYNGYSIAVEVLLSDTMGIYQAKYSIHRNGDLACSRIIANGSTRHADAERGAYTAARQWIDNDSRKGPDEGKRACKASPALRGG